jgi:tetratricopeptide (TPR) repeat protein
MDTDMRYPIRAACFAVAILSGAAQADLLTDARTAYGQGQWQQAADMYGRLVSQDPSAENLWHLGRADIGIGKDEDAKRVLQQSLAKAPGDLHAQFYLAVTLAKTGDKDGAFSWLEKGIKQGLPGSSIAANPGLASLHDDPRYASLLAEAEKLAHPCPTDPRYRAFDFWVGDWDVYVAGEKTSAHNHISMDLQGCLIRERWTGGGDGESLNFFNPYTGKWHQSYVDDSGSTVWYDGGPVAIGLMHMEGGYANIDGSTGLARVTWTRNPDGSVHHFIERSTDGGRNWDVYFDAVYRAAAPASTP